MNIPNKYYINTFIAKCIVYLSDLPLLFHSTGIANSQSNFRCGPVCLLAEWSCFCELTNNNADSFFGLTWSLRDLNMQQVGQGASFISGSDSAGTTRTFAKGQFIANVTNATEPTIASIATGTVNQTTDRYSLQCTDVNGAVGDAEITIPGKLLPRTDTS